MCFSIPDGQEQTAPIPAAKLGCRRPIAGYRRIGCPTPCCRPTTSARKVSNAVCYIACTRGEQGPDAGKVDTETYYPADGDAQDKVKVRDYNSQAKEHNHRWRFDFVAGCREQTSDTNPHVHEKEYRHRRIGE